MKEALIRIDMFTQTQTLFIRQDNETIEFRIKLKDVPSFVVNYGIEKLHLYGKESFISKYAKDILEAENFKNSENHIDILINE